MDFLTFAFIDIVLEFPERISFPIDHLVRLVHTLSFFIWMVDEKCLEIINVEVRWWQEVSIGLWLLFFLLFSLWCLSNCLLLFFLLWSFSQYWFQRFLAHLDLSENVNIFRKSKNVGSPGINVLDGLHETLIKYSLETIH